MSLLVILGIWVAVSAVVAPLVGYFLAGRRAAKSAPKPDCALDLNPHSRPPA